MKRIVLVGAMLVALLSIIGLGALAQAAGHVDDDPPTVVVHSWATDGVQSGDIITTELAYGIGIAIYHYYTPTQNVTATVTFESYPAEWNPTPYVGAGLTGNFSYEGGVFTWQGVLRGPGDPSEFWVNVGENRCYQRLCLFYTQVELFDGRTFSRVNGIYNPQPEPPPLRYVFVPVVVNNWPPFEALVHLDVSASDGINNSGSDGVLETDRAFAVNVAIYPLTDDSITAKVIFYPFDPEWSTTFNRGTGIYGSYSYDSFSESWTWEGDLRMGQNVPSEFWISVPDNALHGSQTFHAVVEINGLVHAEGQVTVISP